MFIIYNLTFRYGTPSWHAVRLYWVPGHAGVTENEIADRLTTSGSGQQFIGPEPFLGVTRQNIRKKINPLKHTAVCETAGLAKSLGRI